MLVYMLLKGYFSKWPPGGATGALGGGLEAPVGSQYLIWGISMYIYYVYTTKSIGSKSVTRRLRKKKQRYKIPSQSARDLKKAWSRALPISFFNMILDKWCLIGCVSKSLLLVG